MKNVLVTGGTGFIGSHLVSYLLSKGIYVRVIDKSIHKPTWCDIRKAELIEGDVLSHELLFQCLQEADTCFHLAALSSIGVCSRDWIFSHENNVLAFNGLLEEIRRTDHPVKLVYASSAAVYGDCPQLPATESGPAFPLSTYGADKLSNELYAEVVHKLYGIPSLGLRLFNVYGPGQISSNPYSGVITSFKRAILNDEPIKIYGDGLQTRDFIFIDDIVDGFIKAAETPQDTSGIFNICSGVSTTIQALAELIIDLSGKKLAIKYEPAKADDLRHSTGNPLLAAKILGFKTKTSMQQGLDIFLKDNTFNY